MRAADEKQERRGKGKSSRGSGGKKWGRYTHYTPDKDSKAEIRKAVGISDESLLLWIDQMLDSGYTLSLHWIEAREAIRAQLRAPGIDPMLEPAIAAYHASARVALHALKRAVTVDCQDWQTERATAEEADNW